ncbi:MAG: hypothetical protein KGI69_02555 [Patescibacteria group bacterium]|nr:hypothetical protein [Patescibacteria group bacterium]
MQEQHEAEIIQLQISRKPVTLVRKPGNRISITIPELRTIGGHPLGSWEWRSLDGLTRRLQSMNGGRMPHYHSFRPEYVSNGRFTTFVWVEYSLRDGSALVTMGDIVGCSFKSLDQDPHTALLVPMGWACEVVSLTKNGITGFVRPMEVITSNGEIGKISGRPSFDRFEYAHKL